MAVAEVVAVEEPELDSSVCGELLSRPPTTLPLSLPLALTAVDDTIPLVLFSTTAVLMIGVGVGVDDPQKLKSRSIPVTGGGGGASGLRGKGRSRTEEGMPR